MRFFLISITFLLIGGFASYLYFSSRTYYEGEVSDHFDGTRFFNPTAQNIKTFGSFLKWQLTKDQQPWPKWVDNRHECIPPQSIKGSKIRVSHINHASVLIQTEGHNFLTDPIYRNYASPIQGIGPKRVHEPGIKFENLPPIHFVLISHNHYEHMDIETLRKLHQAHKPLFITPLGNDKIIKSHIPDAKIIVLDWGEDYNIGTDFKVTAEAVQHWSARTPFDRNKALWGGFVIQTKRGNIFFAGDSGLGSGIIFKNLQKKYQDFEVSLLPIGGYKPRWFMKFAHFNPKEAVIAHQYLQAKKTIGIHFECFEGLTDEGYDEPRKDLKKALQELNISPDDFIAPYPGQFWEF
jgi:L-ascorbate metabolism protein UlaG (beta-lactamase superfamily)